MVLPFATVRRVMPGQISIVGFSCFIFKSLRGRVSRANDRFAVVNALPTFRAIRVRPMEEQQQGKARDRFYRSAGAVEIQDRALARQRCFREALHGGWDNWLGPLVCDYHLSRRTIRIISVRKSTPLEIETYEKIAG